MEYWRHGVLTPGEAANVLERTQRTLARMADRGELRVFKTLGGRRRYSLTDIMAVLERRQREQ